MTLIEEYIKNLPEDQQKISTEMYLLIKELLPEAEEKMAYGMPTFFQNENVVHFAPAKKHMGFYPTPSAVSAFADKLTDYKTSKGAVQFPYSQELPKKLITEMVLFRKEEALKKAK